MVSYLGSAAGGFAQGFGKGMELGNQWDQKRQDKQSADTVGGALKDWASQQLNGPTQPPQNVPVPGAAPMTGLQQAPAMPTAFQPPQQAPQAPMPGEPSVPAQPGTQQAPADPGLRWGGNPGDPSSGPVQRPPIQQAVQQNPGLGANPNIQQAKGINYGGGPFTPDSLQKLLGGESGGKTLDQLRSMPGTHSAGGFFQFQPGTAKDVAARHPELRGKDPYGSKEDAAAYAQAYAQDNAQAMQRAGVPVTQGTLMLAHQQGADGAKKLLMYPDARAVDLVGNDAVVKNGGSVNMSAREFTQHVIGYYDKQGGGQGGQHPEDFQGHSLPMSGAPGPMNMQQLVGLIMARNPNISNAALARAVERMSPLLNMESRAAYNQQLMDFKYQQQEDKIRMLEMQIAGRQQAAETQAGARVQSAQIGADSRKAVAGINAEASHERVQQRAQAAAQKSEQFQQNQERLVKNHDDAMMMAERKLQEAKDEKERAMVFRQIEAANRQYRDAMRSKIQADSFLSEDDKNALNGQLMQDLKDAQEQLDNIKKQFREKPAEAVAPKEQPAPAAPAASPDTPKPVPSTKEPGTGQPAQPPMRPAGVPEDAEKAPDGNWYVKRDGKYYRVNVSGGPDA